MKNILMEKTEEEVTASALLMGQWRLNCKPTIMYTLRTIL